MISIATLNVSVKESIKFVRNTNLLGNYNSNVHYPDNMPSELRSLTYEKAWEKCIQENWYNIQLEDGSLLIFKHGSYSYLMTPIKTLTYEDYLSTFFPEEEWGNAEEYKVMISQEYDNYVISHTQNHPPMPVRYDIDEEYYCEHSHPYCHFHFGSENDGRIATKKILTPMAFSAFILRSFYRKSWKPYAESELINEHLNYFKQNLDYPLPEFWKAHEDSFLFIS